MRDASQTWNEEIAQSIIAAHKQAAGPLLIVLQALQEKFGRVPDEAIPLIAEALNLSRAEVHGVVTFYHDFHAEPLGRHVLKLCRAEACQSMGGEKLAEHVSRTLGIGFGETTPDARLTLQSVYCLGLCACAPAAQFDGRPVGRLSERTVAVLIAEAQS